MQNQVQNQATQQASLDLRIAAAADLQPVLPALIAQYRAETGVRLTASFGSSATLTQQIENGAPADIFLSADCTHPQQLADTKRTTGPEPTLYARGQLVLWARKDSPAQPLSLAGLGSSHLTHVAVANDLHAPYGQAATAAIHALHLEQALTGKLVIGENIAQTGQFALTGNAQAAFLSLTLATSPQYRSLGTFISIPAVYPPIRQCGVVLRSSTQASAATAFLHWLTSAPIQKELPAFGLDPAK